MPQQGIDCLKILPRAPQFRGTWDAAVKRLKKHLRRILGLLILKFQELLIVLNQIEAIDHHFPRQTVQKDCSPVTTGHFLFDDSFLSMLQDDVTLNNNQRFNLIQRINQDF